MLVIHRRPGESVRIGRAHVKVLPRYPGDDRNVALGIDAPPDVDVERDDARDKTPLRKRRKRSRRRSPGLAESMVKQGGRNVGEPGPRPPMDIPGQGDPP